MRTWAAVFVILLGASPAVGVENLQGALDEGYSVIGVAVMEGAATARLYLQDANRTSRIVCVVPVIPTKAIETLPEGFEVEFEYKCEEVSPAFGVESLQSALDEGYSVMGLAVMEGEATTRLYLQDANRTSRIVCDVPLMPTEAFETIPEGYAPRFEFKCEEVVK